MEQKRIKGMVIRGKGEAKKTGYPTANISLDFVDELFETGVYASKVLCDGKKYKAAFIVKANPNKAEIHLMGFDKDIYGDVLEIIFAKKVSEIQALEGQSLQDKIEEDVKKIKKVLGQ